MAKTNVISRRTTAALAIIFLLPPLIFFILWSSISLKVTGISEMEKMKIYLAKFPDWLQYINTIHTISIIGCLLSIIFAVRSFSKLLLSVKVLMLITIVVAAFIIIFDVYQIF